MTAKEMFGKLGFEITKDFYVNQRKFDLYYSSPQFNIGFDFTTNSIYFDKTLNKVGSVNLTIDVYRAIQKQIEELGWIE